MLEEVSKIYLEDKTQKNVSLIDMETSVPAKLFILGLRYRTQINYMHLQL